MSIEFMVETERKPGTTTVIAHVRHSPDGKWYRSEVDIVEPHSVRDLPDALRTLADELEKNLGALVVLGEG